MTDTFRIACHKHLSLNEYSTFYKKYDRLLQKIKRNPPNSTDLFDLIYHLLDIHRGKKVNNTKKSKLVGLLEAKIIDIVRITSKSYRDESTFCRITKILMEMHANRTLEELFIKETSVLEYKPLLDIVEYFYLQHDYQKARFFMQLILRRHSSVIDCWYFFYSNEKVAADSTSEILEFIKQQAQKHLGVECIFEELCRHPPCSVN